MSTKLYATIGTNLVDGELEAKVNVEAPPEAQSVSAPTNLYAAVNTSLPEAASVVADSLNKSYAYVAPTKLYTQIVPEKPSILAAERIFVYVPKASYNSAGIAKFKTTQFNIINGEVSIKDSYLSQMLAANLIKPELILIVEELPEIGLDNRIYLVPTNSTISTGYIWASPTQTWSSLGEVSLAINNYYTKAEVTALLADGLTALTDVYTKSEVDDLVANELSKVSVDLSDYYNKATIDNLLSALTANASNLKISADVPTNANVLYWGKLTER